jgi:hypothetical protein
MLSGRMGRAPPLDFAVRPPRRGLCPHHPSLADSLLRVVSRYRRFFPSAASGPRGRGCRGRILEEPLVSLHLPYVSSICPTLTDAAKR